MNPKIKKNLAIFIPILFMIDVIIMFVAKLQRGDVTALIGGTAIFILILVSILNYKEKALEEITKLFVDGFKFGFEVFGTVIPP